MKTPGHRLTVGDNPPKKPIEARSKLTILQNPVDTASAFPPVSDKGCRAQWSQRLVAQPHSLSVIPVRALIPTPVQAQLLRRNPSAVRLERCRSTRSDRKHHVLTQALEGDS